MSTSLQFETRQDSSKKVIYAHGGWLSSFHFTILASHTSGVIKISAVLRHGNIGSTSYASASRYLGYNFSSSLELFVPIRGNHFLEVLAKLVADTSRNFREWLGIFSSEQNELIYRYSDPWERVKDTLWKAIVRHVEV